MTPMLHETGKGEQWSDGCRPAPRHPAPPGGPWSSFGRTVGSSATRRMKAS